MAVESASETVALDAATRRNLELDTHPSGRTEHTLLGVLDETVTTPGLQNYSFALPATYSSSNYVLGFRLDSFTNVISSISITNVSLDFAGLTNPITLGRNAGKLAASSNPAAAIAPPNWTILR